MRYYVLTTLRLSSETPNRTNARYLIYHLSPRMVEYLDEARSIHPEALARDYSMESIKIDSPDMDLPPLPSWPGNWEIKFERKVRRVLESVMR